MITSFKHFRQVINGKTVLLVGGGPDAGKLKASGYETHEVIIRCNNFKFANSCKRTDIWYSYFGRNIKDVEEVFVQYSLCGLPLLSLYHALKKQEGY